MVWAGQLWLAQTSGWTIRAGDNSMLTHVKGLLRWFTGLLKMSLEEMKQAGVFLGQLRD